MCWNEAAVSKVVGTLLIEDMKECQLLEVIAPDNCKLLFKGGRLFNNKGKLLSGSPG